MDTIPIHYITFTFTVMCNLTMVTYLEKCIHHCANIIECTHTELDAIAYYTTSLLLCGVRKIIFPLPFWVLD